MGTTPQESGDAGSSLIDQWLAKREPVGATPEADEAAEIASTEDAQEPDTDLAQDETSPDFDTSELDPLTAPLPELMQREQLRRGGAAALSSPVAPSPDPDPLPDPTQHATTPSWSGPSEPDPLQHDSWLTDSGPTSPSPEPSGQLSDDERRERLSRMLKSRLAPKDDPTPQASAVTAPPPVAPPPSRRAGPRPAPPTPRSAGVDWQRALFNPSELVSPVKPDEENLPDAESAPIHTATTEAIAPEPAVTDTAADDAAVEAPEPEAPAIDTTEPTLLDELDQEGTDTTDVPGPVLDLPTEDEPEPDEFESRDPARDEPVEQSPFEEPTEVPVDVVASDPSEARSSDASDEEFETAARTDVFAALRDDSSPEGDIDTREGLEQFARTRSEEEARTSAATSPERRPTHSGEPDTPKISDAAVMEPALQAVLRSSEQGEADKKSRFFGRRKKRRTDSSAIRRAAMPPSGQRIRDEEDDLPGWLNELREPEASEVDVEETRTSEEEGAPAPVPESDSDAEPEGDPVVEPEPQASTEPEPGPGPEPDSLVEPGPEIMAEPEIVAEPEPVAVTEPDPLSDPFIEPEPELVADSEPASETDEPKKFETLEELLAAATLVGTKRTITKPVIEPQLAPEERDRARAEKSEQATETPAAVQESTTDDVPEVAVQTPQDSRTAAAASVFAAVSGTPEATPAPAAKEQAVPKQAVAKQQTPKPKAKQPPAPVKKQPAKPAKSTPAHLPDVIELSPQRGTQRFLGFLLMFALMSTCLLGWLAWDTRETQNIAYAATAAVLALILWGAHSTAEPAKIVCERGLLDIRSNDSHYRFDLSSPYTRVEVHGTAGKRGWKVHILRKSMAPYVINDSMVNPEEFTRILDHYEASRNRSTH